MNLKPPKSEQQLDLLFSENPQIRWLDLSESPRRQIQTLLAQLMAGLVMDNKRQREIPCHQKKLPLHI